MPAVCSIKCRDDLDTELVQGSFNDIVNALNLAAAKGHQFAIMDQHPSGVPVGFETRNITKIKPVEDIESAYVGS